MRWIQNRHTFPFLPDGNDVAIVASDASTTIGSETTKADPVAGPANVSRDYMGRYPRPMQHWRASWSPWRSRCARTPKVRAEVDRLLAKHPDYSKWTAGVSATGRGRAAFLEASVWPDTIKSDRRFANKSPSATGKTRSPAIHQLVLKSTELPVK
jgi:hypothetical protein